MRALVPVVLLSACAGTAKPGAVPNGAGEVHGEPGHSVAAGGGARSVDALPPPPPPPARAAPAPVFAEPVPAAERLTLRPLTARDGVLPHPFSAGSAGPCVMLELQQLEGLNVADGVTRWKAPAWSYVLGELPDGALVAVADAQAGLGQVKVGVLERADGTVRFTCEAPNAVGSLVIGWRGNGVVFTADVSQPQVVTGTYRSPDGMFLGEVALTVSAKACALSRVFDGRGEPWVLPSSWKAGRLTIGHLDTSASGAVAPSPTDDALVARRGSKEVWRRPLPRSYGEVCAVP